MDDIKFHLEINKNRVQEGNTKNMLFSFDAIISYASKYFTLKKATSFSQAHLQMLDQSKLEIDSKLILDKKNY